MHPHDRQQLCHIDDHALRQPWIQFNVDRTQVTKLCEVFLQNLSHDFRLTGIVTGRSSHNSCGEPSGLWRNVGVVANRRGCGETSGNLAPLNWADIFATLFGNINF